MSKRSLQHLLIALLVGGLFTITTAFAQGEYPTDTIRLLVPASPGGGTDIAARLLGDHLQKRLGVNVVIVNQAGGGGVIAQQTVADARADGSTLLFYHAMMHVASLTEQSPYSYTDFTPIATISEANDVFAVSADAPWDSLAELLEYARENPGEVVIGSQLGGTTQIKGEALALRGSVDMRTVDVGTESDRIASLLGGHVDMVSMSVGNAQQYVESGDIKVLAVLNEERDSFAPDWPTAAEEGVDIHFPLVFTLYGPPDLSESVVTTLSETIAEIAQDPVFVEQMETAQQHISYRSVEETALYLDNEVAFVEEAITDVGE